LDDPFDLVAPDPPVAAPVDPEEAEPDELAVPAAFVPGDVGTFAAFPAPASFSWACNYFPALWLHRLCLFILGNDQEPFALKGHEHREKAAP
jgi:hypothetical protein